MLGENLEYFTGMAGDDVFMYFCSAGSVVRVLTLCFFFLEKSAVLLRKLGFNGLWWDDADDAVFWCVAC